MVVSLNKMTQGQGIKYLLASIARGDGAVDMSSPLTRYYAESGCPPGRFVGAGLRALDGGRGVEPGTHVTELQLRNMLEVIGDPITGEFLGKRSGTVRSDAKKVCGFDLTFSPSKSISAAWAVADAGTQGVIYQSHLDAMQETLAYAEKHVFFSRSGSAGVVQEEIEGVIAAAFDHWDSRAGDPQLHTHLIIENLARSVSDGQWRTIDSRGLHGWAVSLSEMHQGILTDLLAERLGWSFDDRGRVHSDKVRFEVTGVSNELQAEFSQRSAAINAETDRLVAAYVGDHGRRPGAKVLTQMKQRATLTTRPDKHHHSLAEQTKDWRERARPYVGEDTVGFVQSLAEQAERGLRLRADDFTPEQMDPVVEAALINVIAKHPTFNRANVLAEVHRQMQGWTFATPAERIAAGERVADHALNVATGHVVDLTPPDRRHVPARFKRPDGSSKLAPATARLYTTHALVDAERRLLELSRTTAETTSQISSGAGTSLVASLDAVVAVVEANLPGKDHKLSDDQAYAVEQVATSGRGLDVLVGPAGTGKTTSMAGLRAVWEAEHGAGSVVGLAPSARAAGELGEGLGIPTENTAKWLHEHKRAPDRMRTAASIRAKATNASTPIRRAQMIATAEKIEAAAARFIPRAGQLIIIDESSLAGTFTLDAITQAAAAAGAKVLLVGDPNQLSAVAAGGAFRMLINDRAAASVVPQLTEIRRFSNPWERAASLQLRVGDASIIETYLRHGRVLDGDRETMLDALYTNWLTDVREDKTTLMIAGDNATVAELNRRAQADRITGGEVAGREAGTIALRDGNIAHLGDRIVTRQGKRELGVGHGYVKNGDEWIVQSINPDGSVVVQRAIQYTNHLGHGAVVLPADYVAEQVELGYATTAHRAQGATVQTAHAMVTATTQRELLYVASSRAQDTNMLYVDTHYDPNPETSHGPTDPRPVHQLLAGVLDNTGADVAALDHARTLAAEHNSLAFLHLRYASITRQADADHWTHLVDQVTANLSQEEGNDGARAMADEVLHSPHIDVLRQALRDAYVRGLDPEQALTDALVGALADTGNTPGNTADVAVGDLTVTSAEGGTETRNDLAARTARLVSAGARNLTPEDRPVRDRSVVGLLAYPHHVTDPDSLRAIDEYVQAMEADARRIAETALSPGHQTPEWLRDLGTPPAAPAAREAWLKSARTVAAYRQLHGYHGTNTEMISAAVNRTELGDARAATAAAEGARRLAARHSSTDAQRSSAVGATHTGAEPAAEAGLR